MPLPDHTAADSRLAFRWLLASGTHAIPGAFNAASALLAERAGFRAVYLSGAGVANAVLGVPDVGLTTLDEAATQVRYLAEATPLPVVVDADTGFGEALNVRRTVRALEAAGAAALHLEDQLNPKRCGHLEGKQLVPPEEMVRKLAAAVEARRDPNLVIIARTDAAGVEGIASAIARAKRYVVAGAELVFPDGLTTPDDFRRFAEEVPAPLLANMTEFGKTPYLTVEEFAALGCRFVLFPLTAFRVAMRAVEESYRELAATGSQQSLLDQMQTRAELYDLVRYADYAALDERLAGFEKGIAEP